MWTVAMALLAGAPASFGQPVVTITGGPDESGHNYSWIVEHDYEAPIVLVEFPQYMVDLFTPPHGWMGTLTTAAMAEARMGKCTAVAADESNGISRGSAASFSMRTKPYAGVRGVRNGKGDVLIRFADGTQVTVRAQVPIRESAFSRYVLLIGFGLMAVIVFSARARKRRRARRAADVEGME